MSTIIGSFDDTPHRERRARRISEAMPNVYTLRISDEEAAIVNAEAAKHGGNRSAVLRRLITAGLEAQQATTSPQEGLGAILTRIGHGVLRSLRSTGESSREDTAVADIISEFPNTYNGIGRPRRYPWDEWSDGQIRIIRRGEDYSCATDTIRASIYRWAVEHGQRARVQHIDDDTLAFRISDDDGPTPTVGSATSKGARA